MFIDHFMELEDQRSLCFTHEKSFRSHYRGEREKGENIFWLSAFRISCSLLARHNAYHDFHGQSSVPNTDITNERSDLLLNLLYDIRDMDK